MPTASGVPSESTPAFYSRSEGRSFVIFLFGYLLALQFSERLYGSLGVPSPFWLPDSVLLCAVLLAQKRHWWVLILSTWLIRLIPGAPAGTPSWFVFFAAVVDSLKALLSAWLLQHWLPRSARINTLRGFLIFLGVAGGAVPLVSALAAAPARHVLGDPLWEAGYRWFLGDALAQAVVTPTLLYWCTRSYRHANARLKELCFLCGGLIPVLYYAFLVRHDSYSPVFLYSPVPFLVWAAVRLRPFGTANSMALVACVAMLSAVRGTGVFSGGSADESVLSIQLFLLVVSVPLLSVAILNAERESKVQELETLLDAVPIPILIATGAECENVRANYAGYQTRGMPPGTNLSKRHPSFADMPFRIMRGGVDIPPSELPLQKATDRGTPVSGERFTLALKDGTKREVVAYAAPLPDEDGKARGAVGAFLDITELRMAEEALRESEERLRLVADTAPVLIWMAGTDKLYTFLNKTWLDFTSRSLAQGLGDGWSSGVHPDDLERCLGIYSTAFDARVAFEMEYRFRRYDGEYRWVVNHGRPRFESDGTFCGYIGSCVDITQRRMAEESLRELSGRLMHTQEQERARIARELHDDLGQRMALLQIGVEQLEQRANGLSSDGRKELRRIAEAASQMASDMHELSHQLHPSKLDALGLIPALRSFCREFSAQHRISIQFSHHDLPEDISRDAKLCMFRIAQEALRNVVKHGGVSEAVIELWGEDDRVDLSISDKGVGFDLASLRERTGLGLISMRERLRLVGGRLLVRSTPGGGTRLHASVPVPTVNEVATEKARAHRGGA